MKTIKHEEIYENLSSFLKSKGVELTDGSYVRGIRQGCEVLADTVNAAQRTVSTAKTTVESKLDQLRQSIHKATAPKGADEPASAKPAGSSRKRRSPSKRAPATPVKPKTLRKRSK